MNTGMHVIQKPDPGIRLLKFRGDTMTFRLSLSDSGAGTAFLRTNIGHARVSRKEIIEAVHADEPPMGRDWFDISMPQTAARDYQVTLPLCEVGHFEAKGYFIPEKSQDPLWASGPNMSINVEPADTCCANIMYNAFIRQFGANKKGGFFDPARKKGLKALDNEGYIVIPPSGTFRDLIAELDFIVGQLGCRIIQLLPVYPTPTSYGRMGRYGSPYAALSFTAVDPALAEFDPKATPLEQFIELVDAVHTRQAKIFIDMAINHTGWAAGLHEIHPQWLVRNPQGEIKNPGAWGVRWEDLTQLDYGHKDLWPYMADVFLIWCRRGVDGFRCDAAYMIPIRVWKYIIARVREQFPDTLFFLEGLGGKVSVTRALLNEANFNWAYSELFQQYTREQIENYLPGAIDISKAEGVMAHYAETHDNPRLAAQSRAYAGMRTALCALCSHQGAFGFANGVEWYATEKINVHESPSLNWGSDPNQVQEIRRLSTLLKHHPAFHDQTELRMIRNGAGNFMVLLRHHLPTDKKLMVIVNLDDQNPTRAHWDPSGMPLDGTLFVDLLSGRDIKISEHDGINSLHLDPAQVFCLSADRRDLEYAQEDNGRSARVPDRITRQQLRAKALDVFHFYHGLRHMGDFNADTAAAELGADPLEFCRQMNPLNAEPKVVTWLWPRDKRREVMVPPNHFLLVKSKYPFRARLLKENRVKAGEKALPCSQGMSFVLFKPLKPPPEHSNHFLKLVVYEPGRCEHWKAPLLYLAKAEQARPKRIIQRKELLREPFTFLSTNGRGGMLRIPLNWGELRSRYDALLAANLNADYPVDRWVMFTRCRAWVVFQDYSQEINKDCQAHFTIDEAQGGIWRFRVPIGKGQQVLIKARLEMLEEQNVTRILFFRPSSGGQAGQLADDCPIQLILRPDIENRNFHDVTKAYLGPEHDWPKSVTVLENGFRFTPDDTHTLEVSLSGSTFVPEPEWRYMVHRPDEAERGLDPDSDLFSPGYLTLSLAGAEKAVLTACISGPGDPQTSDSGSGAQQKSFTGLNQKSPSEVIAFLKAGMNQFVVKRGDHKTVIAGYPWFLDWGRDTIIFARGLIAAGQIQTAGRVLKQFARFEINGTLPNMIQGESAQNRDTSDAPLWFCVACRDLVQAEGQDAFLKERCGDRTILEILQSIGRAYVNGTPNGIQMDPDTGLIFSPAHFTWMDTDHPAGTPRQGYPIEIQALWFATLKFMVRIQPDTSQPKWRHLADRVRASIAALFFIPQNDYLSDCLHGKPGLSARQAQVDDALRPNQLLGVTLGAIEDPHLCRKIVAACEELLVPGAVRSLASRPLERPLAIFWEGRTINDPLNPYWGQYRGDENTRRKPAYHNGTAWTWVLPLFCEAWVKAYGDTARETALAWLASAMRLINGGCVGHTPEIVDGDYPHQPRGCDAQAWGLSELIRVWIQLSVHP